MKILIAVFACIFLASCGGNQNQNSSAPVEQQKSETAATEEKPDTKPLKLVAQKITLGPQRSFNLFLPQGYEIRIAANGFTRPRFMAISPDNRLFVTDMINLSDNTRGEIYILSDFDSSQGRFQTVTPYLKGLHNPNSVAFYADKDKREWLYVALTEKLIRYRYTRGEIAPSSEAETIATFPDYGLSYKYGGWHLTRTVAPGPNGKIYVSVGSSCNSCEEKEEVRATILEMDPDGQNQRISASGLRNAVGLKWVDRQLYATCMGADHLGDDKPADTMYEISDGAFYGWPYCYQSGGAIYSDPKLNPWKSKRDCKNVPLAFAEFAAHSSPLGLEYFDKTVSDSRLKNSFLVALHGSSNERLRRGYRIARVVKGDVIRDFITGFLQAGRIYGRPADVIRFGKDAFLFTDDHAGLIYYVSKRVEEEGKAEGKR
jgi:glucose/arabinose dehydrogenase